MVAVQVVVVVVVDATVIDPVDVTAAIDSVETTDSAAMTAVAPSVDPAVWVAVDAATNPTLHDSYSVSVASLELPDDLDFSFFYTHNQEHYNPTYRRRLECLYVLSLLRLTDWLSVAPIVRLSTDDRVRMTLI